jgi:hypothetical protein
LTTPGLEKSIRKNFRSTRKEYKQKRGRSKNKSFEIGIPIGKMLYLAIERQLAHKTNLKD